MGKGSTEASNAVLASEKRDGKWSFYIPCLELRHLKGFCVLNKGAMETAQGGRMESIGMPVQGYMDSIR